MKYLHIPPPACLKDYVRYYWVLESNVQDVKPKTFITIADGCPGIIFQESTTGPSKQDDKTLPVIYLYGQTTGSTAIQSPSAFRTIGVYFYPHALKSIFGFDAHELTNNCTGLDVFQKDFRLEEQLLAEKLTSKRIELITNFLLKKIIQNTKQEQSIVYAVHELMNGNGQVDLNTLRTKINLTERTFERKFQHTIGLSPKLFSRISRFQASLNQLRNKSFSKLSDIAFDQNYADQSHFIRAFKEFAGCTPNLFYKSTNEVIENFPELIV